jgi:N-acetylglucosaminyl-diphospho-decaprenol L-rhamnosyltransferase
VADLAVIIVSYNCAEWLEPCLSSVFARAGDIALDVLVVDNDSSDGSADLVEAEFPEARVLRCENRGFAYGNNHGFLASDAPFVLFLNPDAEIVDGTLEDVVGELRRRPQVGLAGCRQVTLDGELYPTIRRFPSPLRLFFEAVGSERFPVRASWLGERELDPAAYDRNVACDWTSGSFMLARREAVLAAGLMDERFFIYCEEPDLCLGIRRGGFEVRHLPSMTIRHPWGKAGFDARLVAQDAYARRQYIDKHFSGGRRTVGLLALGLGHAVRAVAASGDDRRTASRAALRTLAGRSAPPFRDPPSRALSPHTDRVPVA